MYRIGIDLGGTNIAAGIVNESYEIIKKGSVPTLAAERTSEEIAREMARLCRTLVEEAGVKPEEIASIGIGAPGSVDPLSGKVTYCCTMPFHDFPMAEAIRAEFPIEKIYLENDANAAALGEAKSGAAKGTNSSVMITLGTGVGGGIIIDGKIYSGFNFAGAELGHMVIEQGGVLCTCGRRGCWESYSSATALTRMTKEKMEKARESKMWEMCGGEIGRASAKTAFAAARRGDKAGAEVVDTYIRYLACGVTNIINIFQPEVLSIGGGVCNEGDYLLKPLLSIVESEQFTHERTVKTQVRIASLGNDAGIIGAAALGE